MTRKMTCDRCGEVIGVYEPIVTIVAGEAHETSRAAEHPALAMPGLRYHRDCYGLSLQSSGPTGQLRRAV
jgi:hypothetical protein